MGAISLHGPHHSAQKSTRTGWSEALISSSNVASVRAVRVLIGSGFLLGSGGIVPACFSNVPHPCPHSFPVRWRVMPDYYQLVGVLGWVSSQRSASMAAMQPEPAAVIACR